MVFTKKCNICNKVFTKYFREKLCPECWKDQRSWSVERTQALSKSCTGLDSKGKIDRIVAFGKNKNALNNLLKNWKV